MTSETAELTVFLKLTRCSFDGKIVAEIEMTYENLIPEGKLSPTLRAVIVSYSREIRKKGFESVEVKQFCTGAESERGNTRRFELAPPP